MAYEWVTNIEQGSNLLENIQDNKPIFPKTMGGGGGGGGGGGSSNFV